VTSDNLPQSTPPKSIQVHMAKDDPLPLIAIHEKAESGLPQKAWRSLSSIAAPSRRGRRFFTH
jgi:hypothetical protein